MALVDLDAVVKRLDLNEIADGLDLDPLVAKVNLEAVVDRLDIAAVVAKVDPGPDRREGEFRRRNGADRPDRYRAEDRRRHRPARHHP